MLQSPSVHHDGSLRFANPARSLLDGLGWHTCHLSYRGEIPLPGGLGDGIKTRGVLANEFPILQAVTQNYMQHSHQQCEIGSRTQRKVEIRVARDGGHSRIGDDQLAAVIATSPDVVGCDRSAVADVRANRSEEHTSELQSL